MSELIWLSPVWQEKHWFESPLFVKGQTAIIDGIGEVKFMKDCWASMEENGAYAEVEILS